MRIALLHNRRPDTLRPGVPDDAFEEYDRPETIAAVARALEDLGTEVEPVDADARLPWRLDEGRYDFVFNIAEGRGRHCREAVPPTATFTKPTGTWSSGTSRSPSGGQIVPPFAMFG